MKETTDDGRQEVVAKPEGEKGMGATIAIGGPRSRGSSSFTPRGLMWGTARITSRCGRTEIQNQYVGLSVLRRTCIVWPTGNWRPELLFVLQQEGDMYNLYQKRITECDQRLQEQLASWTHPLPLQPPTQKPKTKKPAAKNAPRFDLSSELQRVTGVDLTRVDGIDVMVAQTLLSEAGLDMSRWKTESHFASWLGLCPDNRISGEKVLGRGTRRVVNRRRYSTATGCQHPDAKPQLPGCPQYRRLRTKLGAPKAITAMAHRLARLVYRMRKYGQAYVDKGTQYYDERFRQPQIQLFRKRAAKLGLQVAEIRA